MASTICGFSYGKNLVKTNYPVKESILSILPLVDRFVFVVAKSEDGTREMIAAIDPKIEIIDSEWPESDSEGNVFRIEGQKAMDAAAATGCTWGLHIFCDEVYHENDLDKLRTACDHWQDQLEVKALLMRVLNFVHDYKSIDPWMFRKVCRMYRLDGTLELFGDGCGPGLKKYTGSKNAYLDKHHLGKAVRWAAFPTGGPPARIFHYGWVKTPDEMRAKIDVMEDQYWGELPKEKRQQKSENKFGRFMNKYNAMRNFNESHPTLMAERVADFPPLKSYRNRWLSLRFYRECLKHGIKL